MPKTSREIPVIASVSELAGRSQAWICDIWGVLHNGLEAYPEAAAACRRFRQAGGTVILVTNAPNRKHGVVRRLEELGIGADVWDEVITSGDVSRGVIDEMAPRTFMHLGPQRFEGVIAGLEDRLVDSARADVVLCTGLYDDERESPESYREMLADLAQRKVPLICANPDIMVERGRRLVPCAGALAEIYRELGGEVRYTGKPYPPIYERAYAAIRLLRGVMPEHDNILAIGDGLRTDMAGASRMGLASLYIASALHVAEGRELDPALLHDFFGGAQLPPVAAATALRW